MHTHTHHTYMHTRTKINDYTYCTYMHALTDNCAYGTCTKYTRIQHSCNTQQADTSTVACTKMDDRISPDDQKGCSLEEALTTPEI